MLLCMKMKAGLAPETSCCLKNLDHGQSPKNGDGVSVALYICLLFLLTHLWYMYFYIFL